MNALAHPVRFAFSSRWTPPSSARMRHFAVYAAVLAALVLFGDVLLPLLGHGLILFLEVLELLFERAMEHFFHLDPWRAQLVTAWTGLLALLAILTYLSWRARRIYRAWKAKWAGQGA